MIHPLPKAEKYIASPPKFTFPFCYEPHPLCLLAVQEVNKHLKHNPQWQEELSQGKMFGVLVIEKGNKRRFLAAFSGTLEGKTIHPYFVPPIFNSMEEGCFFQIGQNEISAINHQIKQLSSLIVPSPEILQAQEELTHMREQMSQAKKQRDTLRAMLTEEELKNHEKEFIQESQYQKASYKRLKKQWDTRIEKAEAENNKRREIIEQLEKERKERSLSLQKWLFEQYSFLNARGENKSLLKIFSPSYPPSGAGDCCAPKLLQEAYRIGATPLCMAEYWVGKSPKDEIRIEGHFYPACRSKCLPILHHMLQGLQVDENPLIQKQKEMESKIRILHTQADFVIIGKPCGIPSVPGKETLISVKEFVEKEFPHASGPLIVHRLDMDTSGLMVVALNETSYHHLQKLFIERKVEKKYIALLEHPMEEGMKGILSLPLCPNPDDRPRQMVNETHGKKAVSSYRVLKNIDGHALVMLSPHTGRTHQLRVHCAHPSGLNNPIIGDRLYGTSGERLMLHAMHLKFDHYKFFDISDLEDILSEEDLKLLISDTNS